MYLGGMTGQKEQEYRTFSIFRDLFPDFPKGKIIQNESPDFLIKLNRRTSIGIELTELRGQNFYDQQGHYANPENIKSQIENTIRAKEEKIYLYQKHKTSELWLLIHIDSFENKINFDLKNKIDRWNFEAEFSRVFLLEIHQKKLFQII